MRNRLPLEPNVVAAIVAVIVIISYLHYSTTPGLSQLHAVYRYFYFFPIVYGALRYGFWGGLLTSLIISLVFIPHILFRWSDHTIDAFNDLLVVAVFYGVAIITGITTDRMRKIQALQEQTAADLATSLHRLEVQGTELRRAERLSSLGTLAGGLAHQIRNPVAIIRASAQLLEMAQNGAIAPEVIVIQQESDRVEDLIQRLLNYAGEVSVKRSQITLSELLTHTQERLKPIMDAAQIKFSVDGEHNQQAVCWDEHQIEQALINLCVNAVQALDGPGAIKIKATTSLSAEPTVTLRIVDDGPGLPAAEQQRIFDPFYSTRDNGTGLGLSVAQRIVDEHNGRIWVESEYGRGAAFVMQLPIDASSQGT